jgi:REP element-mobilizing transposase RayT
VRNSRKHPAHLPALNAFNQPVIVFLTICSKDRKAIFTFPDAHGQIVNAWKAAKSWIVGRYVLMPDHHSSILRAHDISAGASGAMGSLLEKPRITKLAAAI